MLSIVASFLLSTLYPGAGHYYLGYRRTCAALLILTCVLLAGSRWFGIAEHFAGFIAFVSVFLALYFAVVIHATWLAWRRVAAPVSTLLLLVPAVLVLLFLIRRFDLTMMRAYIASFFFVYGVIILHGAVTALANRIGAKTRKLEWLVIVAVPLMMVGVSRLPIDWRDVLINQRMEWMGYGPFRIPSVSMLPGLRIGDFFMVDTRYYDSEPVRRGDVVVFWADSGRRTAFIKRVVAVGGDRVAIEDGRLRVNGRAVDEPYVRDNNRRSAGSRRMKEVQVGRNRVFVLGDNRDHSNDSRSWGDLDVDAILGPARYVWLSYDFGERRFNRDRLGLAIQ